MPRRPTAEPYTESRSAVWRVDHIRACAVGGGDLPDQSQSYVTALTPQYGSHITEPWMGSDRWACDSVAVCGTQMQTRALAVR